MSALVHSFVVSCALVAAAGCHASTHGKFTIPHGSELKVNGEAVKLADDGSATLSAFGWGGASYVVSRDGKTLSEGKLDTEFRPISILWPPFGVLYVPKGLDENKTYDLTKK